MTIRKFLWYTVLIFGFVLTFYFIRIMFQQKNITQFKGVEFKGTVFRVMSPVIFAERNLFETFMIRFKRELKFRTEDKFENFFDPKRDDVYALTYPSFAYSSINKGKEFPPIDESKLPELENLDAPYKELIQKNYRAGGKLKAIPIAYIPYAIFFDPESIKPSTKGRSYFTGTLKAAFADDFGSFLAVARIFGLPMDNSSIAALKGRFSKDKTFFFNSEDLSKALEMFDREKPAVVVGPVYLKGYMEERVKLMEMILPEEGTYGTLYLASLSGLGESEFTHVYLNHLIDASIQKTLAEIFTFPVTNKLSMGSMTPVLYNSLKMNDPEYFKKVLILKDKGEYDRAVKLYKAFREGY